MKHLKRALVTLQGTWAQVTPREAQGQLTVQLTQAPPQRTWSKWEKKETREKKMGKRCKASNPEGMACHGGAKEERVERGRGNQMSKAGVNLRPREGGIGIGRSARSRRFPIKENKKRGSPD